ncbi:O-acyltransferase WSD1 [Trifolium repens]|nr:O-acyltransferase WSD1 [Trifolium repens]
MDNLEDVTHPVSPSGQYFNTPILCSYVFGFLESEIPIDDSQTMYLFKHVFLPINPRFSSIMVKDKDGKMKWKKVEVDPKDHIKEGLEFQPCVLSNLAFSLDEIKTIKSNLGVTINDVITGIIFYGIRLYMQEIDNKTITSNSTGLVLLSTRNIGYYQSIQDMVKPNSKSPWGNHISFLHVSIPKLSTAGISNPLEFVWKAQKIIKRKRNTFTVYLIEWLLDMELKLRGHEAVAKHIYGTLRNSSVVISNLIGPVEPMALANHRVKGLYFTMTGGPESINIAVMSYTKTLRITLKTHKGFIDERKFKLCMVKAFEDISKEAMEVHSKAKIK